MFMEASKLCISASSFSVSKLSYLFRCRSQSMNRAISAKFLSKMKKFLSLRLSSTPVINVITILNLLCDITALFIFLLQICHCLLYFI